ncbi:MULTISPECIES: hypothetical protein [Methylomonas]|uniref:Uncharacterized protein n=2 Tax=Methylomonas TaxID=416 RepID=A0A126T3D4_9GAMM|nr:MULTISPECIES: hypothetical protein [Methylomonas]AMK76234.1 hypothetical protein JT25_006970 [Methylomonas denitrificans]OAI00675.1 hypothetical protein A1342_17375 [Methylomonas methanica]TCV88252.1 hypothetical protein EDE11_10139 [Methylomonas methanica]
MSTLAADTVAIHRLTVRAGQQRTADNLRDTLQSAAWPHAGQDSWVFIRRLQVSGTARQLPGQMLDQTRQHLNTSNNPDQVMRFASLAELLAALLADLLRGRAGFNWYWRRWAHWFDLPVSRAVAGILSEHLLLLPSVCARLAQRGELAAVWLGLSGGDARQLAVELAGLIGFRLPSVLEVAELLRSEIDSAEKRYELVAVAQTWAEQMSLRPLLLMQWRPVLRELDVADGRYHLALLLIGRETAPLLLQQQPARALAFLASCFVSPPPAETKDEDGELRPAMLDDATQARVRPSLSNALPKVPSASQAGRTREQAGRDAKLNPDTGVENQTPLPFELNHDAGPDRTNSGRFLQNRIPANRSFTDSTLRATELEQGLQFEPVIDRPEFAGFHTTQGGLLYLLNMLNRSEMRGLMLEHAETLPSGWAWLYRLGQELQLNEDDALVDFIALQLGFEDYSELAQLPPLPARKQVLNLAQRWYGKTGVWQPKLLALAAQIQYSPSHIDLYAPMNAIRLPVRLAGLDINPGWLPWLGRVVSFHYD